MMKHVYQIFLMICVFMCFLSAQAQEDPQENTVKNDISAVERFIKSIKNEESTDELKKIFDESLRLKDAVEKAGARYDISVYEHRQKVFEWQYLSGIIIFCMVVLIVLIGLLFSGLQFYIGWKEKGFVSPSNENDETKTLLTKNIPEPETEFEANIKGIKIRSSVIGIIILVISLCFFYLYLVHVYPVKVIGESGGNIITQRK